MAVCGLPRHLSIIESPLEFMKGLCELPCVCGGVVVVVQPHKGRVL